MMASVTTEPMLQAQGLNKSYGALKVLHDVDIHVMPGEAFPGDADLDAVIRAAFSTS